MSPVIRISDSLYRRLENHVRGFDSPSSVIERMVDFFEANHSNNENRAKRRVIVDRLKSIVESSHRDASRLNTRPTSFSPRTYDAVATGRFSRDLENDNYTLTSPEGVSKTWKLPDENDKPAIKRITQEVEEFVREQGGTIGQIKAARKKLTEFGYHITK